MTRTSADERQADVIVVGAGPAGASTAYHLAQAGVDVLLLEKAAFPRDKICGDGLTPRAVKQLDRHGLRPRRARLAEEQGAAHRRRRPPARAAVARPRQLPAVRRGAHPHGPRRDPRPARREGRRPAHRAYGGHRPGPRRAHRPRGRRDRQAGRRPGPQGRRRGDLPRAGRRRLRRRLLADGDRARAWSAARTGRWRSRSGPTTRPRATTTRGWSPGWSCGTARRGRATCCPATAGSSALGDGTANVGLGILNTSAAFQNVDYKDLLRPVAREHPRGVGLPRREPRRARSAPPRCRWASTASRTTRAGCCSSATRAGW